MPKYNYACRACGNNSSQSLSMKNRQLPCKEPCIQCGESGSVSLLIGNVANVSGVKEPSSAPKEFRNLMGEIHRKAGPKSVIDV